MSKTYGEYVREDYDTFGSPFDFTPSTPAPNAATEKQINFLSRLLVERGLFVSDEELSQLTKKEASARIDALLQTPRAPKVTREPEITDGMYRVSLDGGSVMTIYKVQRAVHGSGKLYAKKLVIDDSVTPAECYFEYAPGVVHKLRPEHKMSLEDAKRFGALYGSCCVCGRTLTKEESIEAGIGPICASKF